MAKTFGCGDIEDNGCPWRVTFNEGEEDLVVSSTITHAETHHPEFAQDRVDAEAQIRSRISELIRQSKYYEQLDPSGSRNMR